MLVSSGWFVSGAALCFLLSNSSNALSDSETRSDDQHEDEPKEAHPKRETRRLVATVESFRILFLRRGFTHRFSSVSRTLYAAPPRRAALILPPRLALAHFGRAGERASDRPTHRPTDILFVCVA